MLISIFPQNIVFAETDDTDKVRREVYIHAFDSAPKLDSKEIRRTVNVGDIVDVYLSVDNPNKSELLPLDDERVIEAKNKAMEKATADAETKFETQEEKDEYIAREVAKEVLQAQHHQPQYDMQGYTVTIYFDTKYFEFIDDSTPINYRVPNDENGFVIPDGDDIYDEETYLQYLNTLKPGYMTHNPSSSDSVDSRKGYASATVFLLSNGFFPDKNAQTKDLWYNLCKLPLRAKQSGQTSVRLEYRTGTKTDLELFAKNVADEKLNFETDVVNDGVFYINIEEAGKPKRPIATKPGGAYDKEIEVQLYHTNTEPCKIFYTRDGITDPRNFPSNNPNIKEYTQGEEISENQVFNFNLNTTLKAAVYRPSDDTWSDVSTFEYEFLPHSPYLFNSKDESISPVYSEAWIEGNEGYYVYACDTENVTSGITVGCTIYYTFDEFLSADIATIESQWTKVDFESQKISEKITKSRTIRLVTVNKQGVSDVSMYHLGIQPAEVVANPCSGLNVEQPISLSCATTGATIYYTTDGSDPRKEKGIEYSEPIYLEKDTVIKAVSYFEGEWSEVSSFWYVFTDKNKSGVSAVYPSGVYVGSVEVILYPDTPGEKIEVSFDNGETWELYDGTVVGDTTTVDKHLEFNARIYKDGVNDNADMGDKFVYIIKPMAPVFSPESREFTKSDVVTVFSPESTDENMDRFELRYSVNGVEYTAPANDIVNIPITGYTTITAFVIKDGEYTSNTVKHSYNIVYDKPAKPTVTLPSGYYTREIGSDEFTTQFVQSPKTDIYYTIGDVSTSFEDPDIIEMTGDTKKYDGEQIEIKNGTVIKAVSVQNVNGKLIKSDVAIFDYSVTPEPPVAAESGIVSELPLIPVDALAVTCPLTGERSRVEYKIGNENGGYVEGFFSTDEALSNGSIRFYIDAKTGNAYKDAQKRELLYDAERTEEFSDTVILLLQSVLDGVESGQNAYAYILDKSGSVILAPPFADKDSGTYSVSKKDFTVNLYTVYEDRADDVKIMWKFDGDTSWQVYDAENPLKFVTVDTIIYAKTVDALGNESPSVGYIYTFNPPAPEIVPESGVYLRDTEKEAVVSQSDDIPESIIDDYRVYYKTATDTEWASFRGDKESTPYSLDKTKTIIAYTKNINRANAGYNRVSATVSKSYVVMDEQALGEAVSIKYPFNRKRIGAHELGKGIYAQGIRFNPDDNIYYEYSYKFTQEEGGGTYDSEPILYDERAAFVPTERIDNMTVTPWINGDKLNTAYTHFIDFIHLGIPETDLEEKNEYEKDTVYHIKNEYKNDPTIIVYYTTDGSDPKLDGTSRKMFSMSELGPEEKLTKTTTVKTAYFSACGDTVNCVACKEGNYGACSNDYVWGEMGEYKYPVPTTVTVGGGGSGGGGGGTIDKTRKYTKDIFGNEHPTHIGYINGYPDGSVQPEGDITREEITSILYRITNHQYEKPFVATGYAFPDVEVGRWSAHDIEYMADKEIVYGYPDGEFKPSRNLSRAEFAALIFRFTGIEKANIKNPFTDLDETHWAYNEILALTNSGLIEGYPDKTYKPENNITRAEVMTVINKLLGRKPLESYVKSLEFNPYNDLYEDTWYYVTVLEATITHNYWLDNKGYEYKWEDWK